MRILFVSLVCLGLGGCFSTTAENVGAAGGAFGRALLVEPEPRYRTRTVVVNRPVYVRPAPRPVTRTITTRVERSW
jgi:hypothetical protein